MTSPLDSADTEPTNTESTNTTPTNTPEEKKKTPQPDPIVQALEKLDDPQKRKRAAVEMAAGQQAFERGRYGRAIAHFQLALVLSNPIGARGGEIQLWLVNAYIAAGERDAGLALCRKLVQHPDLETQRQSRRLLYILEAPELELRPEWVTQIPDLSDLDEDAAGPYRQKPRKPRRRKPKPEPEPLDLSQVNTADNQFVWIALIGILLTLGGLVWLS